MQFLLSLLNSYVFEVASTPKEMTREGSHADVKGNLHFLKKLPAGAEASNVLVGEVDFLTRYITAFVRLKNAATLGDLTEVNFLL